MAPAGVTVARQPVLYLPGEGARKPFGGGGVACCCSSFGEAGRPLVGPSRHRVAGPQAESAGRIGQWHELEMDDRTWYINETSRILKEADAELHRTGFLDIEKLYRSLTYVRGESESALQCRNSTNAILHECSFVSEHPVQLDNDLSSDSLGRSNCDGNAVSSNACIGTIFFISSQLMRFDTSSSGEYRSILTDRATRRGKRIDQA
jgi:hypothetical protein